jgi:small subunit ribosomal protein S19
LKKGPFVDPKLAKKVAALGRRGPNDHQDLGSKLAAIPPEFVGRTLAVHNGKVYTFQFLSPKTWWGTSSANSAPTRKFRSHGGKLAKGQK